MKMIFNYDANKTHFHNKGFALSLVLKMRFFGTRKWPIILAGKGVVFLFFTFKSFRYVANVFYLKIEESSYSA